jgi:hypothetical protein
VKILVCGEGLTVKVVEFQRGGNLEKENREKMLTSYIFCQKGFNKRKHDVKRERFDEKGVSIIDCAGKRTQRGAFRQFFPEDKWTRMTNHRSFFLGFFHV